MRVLVDSAALEALCQVAEDKHKVLVNRVRTSVRAEPKTEEVTKVADYSASEIGDLVDASCTFAPRKRSATEK